VAHKRDQNRPFTQFFQGKLMYIFLDALGACFGREAQQTPRALSVPLQAPDVQGVWELYEFALFQTPVLENNPGCIGKKRASNHSFMSRSRNRTRLGKRLTRRYAKAFDSRALRMALRLKEKGRRYLRPRLTF
jgi:hypothetical protein